MLNKTSSLKNHNFSKPKTSWAKLKLSLVRVVNEVKVILNSIGVEVAVLVKIVSKNIFTYLMKSDNSLTEN